MNDKTPKRIKIIAKGIQKDMEALNEVDITFIEVAAAVQVLSILYDKFPLIIALFEGKKKDVLKTWYKNQDLEIDVKELMKEYKKEEVN